jgi:Cdc6-like AAA superfamily ATPase
VSKTQHVTKWYDLHPAVYGALFYRLRLFEGGPDKSAHQIKSFAGEFGADIMNLTFIQTYWERVQKAAYGRTVCIILDEIDKMLIKNRKNDFLLLYKFSREMDARISGAINNLLFEQMIPDERDRSLFLYDEMIFSPHNANGLRDILERRASTAFHEGVLDQEALPFISAFAGSKTATLNMD